MIRAFLALPVPDDLRSTLTVQQFLLPAPNPVPPDTFHITLCFLGDQPEPVLEDLHHILTALRLPDFEWTLQGIGHFGHDRPRSVHAIVVPTPPLMALQAKIENAARRAGVTVPAQRYMPHITLARFRPGDVTDPPALSRAIAMARLAAGPSRAGRVILYRSAPGPRYDAMADYPLSPPAG
jgi:RNA 2',3'-cyclic 3'-phosphodiesterase